MRRVCLVLIALFVGSAVFTATPPPAAAQKYVPRKVKRQARKLMTLGRRAYRRKRFQKAVNYFLQAFKVWPRRELNFNIAMAYGRLGDKIKAVIYIRRFEQDASARELQSIPKWLREIKDEVAVVNIQGPDGAIIKMDGKEVGTVPAELVILPGMHLFLIIKDGKRFAKRDWDVKPGLRKVWEVVEPRRVVTRPPPTIIIQRPVPTPVPVQPPPPRKGISMWYTITAGALAIAVAGAAIGTGMMAKKLHDDYFANPTRKSREDGILMRDTTNALWGVAGALGVASVVLAIFTQWKSGGKEKDARVPRLDLGVGQGGATVSVSGRF